MLIGDDLLHSALAIEAGSLNSDGRGIWLA